MGVFFFFYLEIDGNIWKAQSHVHATSPSFSLSMILSGLWMLLPWWETCLYPAKCYTQWQQRPRPGGPRLSRDGVSPSTEWSLMVREAGGQGELEPQTFHEQPHPLHVLISFGPSRDCCSGKFSLQGNPQIWPAHFSALYQMYPPGAQTKWGTSTPPPNSPIPHSQPPAPQATGALTSWTTDSFISVLELCINGVRQYELWIPSLTGMLLRFFPAVGVSINASFFCTAKS